MTSAQEWVPNVLRDLKLRAEWKSEVNVNKQTWWLDFNTGRCEMRNPVRLLAAQYMLDSSDNMLDLLAAPLFFRHTNRHRINGRKQRDREQEIQFLHYRRAIELHHYYATLVHVIGSGWSANWLARGQINFSSFRKWSSSDGATARVFWNDLGSSFKTPKNLGVSTRSFDGQLLENSSSQMCSQGPNDRVHARVINFSSRWVSVWTWLFLQYHTGYFKNNWTKTRLVQWRS